MGIKNLNLLLKELCQDAITLQPLTKWSHKRMAIDLNNIIYMYMSVAWKQVVNKTPVHLEDPDMEEVTKIYLQGIKQLLVKILKAKITPVIVCDGPPPPEKETLTRSKRREMREEAQDRCQEFKLTLQEKDPLDITPYDINELRTLMARTPPMSTREIEVVKNVITGLGIPVLQCTGEAEALCSLMSRTGRVDLVYSTDTDNLVHGCINLMTEFSGRHYHEETNSLAEYVKVTNLPLILSRLELRYEQFVDMCIMAGCDYNTNIPRIGIKTSYKLIKEHHSIDRLPSKYNVTCLNHKRCRQLFAHQPFRRSCEDQGPNLNIDLTALSTYARDALEPYGVDYWIPEFLDLYKDFPQPPHTIIMRSVYIPPTLKIIEDREEDNELLSKEEENENEEEEI